MVAKYARLQEVEAREAARRAQDERKAPTMKEPITEDAKPAETSEEPVTPVQDEARTYDFRVWATREQIGRLREFLVGNRIRYGKVPKEGA